jgi:protein CpxP
MKPSLPTLAALSFLSAGAALAQTSVTGQPASPGGTSAQSGGQPAVTRPNTDAMQGGTAQGPAAAAKLEPGANSFTEGQVRSRLEEAGFKDVQDLKKDDQGIWRGKANQNGKPVNVGFDFKGNVATQ